MGKYIFRRLISTIPILLIVSIIIFLFLHMIPGDPAHIAAGPQATQAEIELTRQRLGLDKPLIVQYWLFIEHAATGNFGISNRTGQPVVQQIAQHFGPTLELTLYSIVWAIIVGLIVGMISALFRNRWPDYLGIVLSITGLSMPDMWLGLVLIEYFAVKLGWFPAGGMGGFRSAILPSFSLGLGVAAVIARFSRSSLLDVLHEDYIRTAYAKGMSHWHVIFRHALRNALIPVVTMTGLQFGFLLGGAVVTETVFSWPGIGRLLVEAVSYRDYPTIQALMLLFSVEFIVINLLVDILYSVINPRIELNTEG